MFPKSSTTISRRLNSPDGVTLKVWTTKPAGVYSVIVLLPASVTNRFPGVTTAASLRFEFTSAAANINEDTKKRCMGCCRTSWESQCECSSGVYGLPA